MQRSTTYFEDTDAAIFCNERSFLMHIQYQHDEQAFLTMFQIIFHSASKKKKVKDKVITQQVITYYRYINVSYFETSLLLFST